MLTRLLLRKPDKLHGQTTEQLKSAYCHLKRLKVNISTKSGFRANNTVGKMVRPYTDKLRANGTFIHI